MPSSSPIHLRGFELRGSTVESLAALVGASSLALAEQEMRELETSPVYDIDRWHGFDREWTLGGIQGRLAKGTDITWIDWEIITAEGIVYKSTTSVSTDPPRMELLDDAPKVHFRIAADYGDDAHGLELDLQNGFCTATVSAPEESIRELTKEIRSLLEEHATPTDFGASVRPFRVFIAYGGGRMWEVVRDYLQDAEIEVDAFTESERASQLTIDVVSGMIHSASLAVIVMTAADKIGDSHHARQNVIHELGFSQGVLGLQRTVLLKEEGVTLPTNLDGMTYISFRPGEIHTTRDRVVNLVKAARADQSAGFA